MSLERQTGQRRWSLNPIGLLFGAVPLLLSLTPSLLPRPATLQGLGSGVVFGLRYAVGVGVSAILARLIKWRPSAKLGRRLWLIGWLSLAVVLVLAAVAGVAAQNEVRRMVELPPLDGVNVSRFVVTLLLTSLTCLGIGRLVRAGWQRRLARMVEDGRSLRLARRQATVRTSIVIVTVLAVLLGVIYLSVDRIYHGLNGWPEAGLTVPESTYRSAGAGSEVEFDQLGRHGADFIAGGPTASQISELTGEPAMTPIRVYVGVAAGGTLADRVATAVRELERTGGFERKVLVVATTTGAGWLEPQAVDSVEYLQSGDTATVALQYAYTPSWMSALTAPELPTETSSALFTAVRAKWLTLPADSRPQLVAYGLSLGAQANMNSFGTLEAMLERTQGALLVGPTNTTPLWRELQDTRDAGSPVWQPVLDNGAQVRWASKHGDFEQPAAPWRTPRVAILQHATDPITWLGPELIWQRPQWLTQGNRAPDVSPRMHWIPLVTAVQVTLDMLVSVQVPARHGHAFGDVMLDGWVAITDDGGLDQAARQRIQEVIEDYSVIRPVNV